MSLVDPPGVGQADQDGVELSPAVPETGTLRTVRRLNDRYRLERVLRSAGGADVWLALDEKLRRAVVIYLMDSGTDALGMLGGARSAAAVHDPRFLHILDAVDDGTHAYVVTEWPSDAVDLSTTLGFGPLSVPEAVQLAREVAQAMASAHAVELQHLGLVPHSVLRTATGQVKVHGLCVEAALAGRAGMPLTRAVARDVRSVGELFYAALTARWPTEARYGLEAAPREDGKLQPPSTVVPGIPAEVDALAMRLIEDGVPRSGGPQASCLAVVGLLGSLPREPLADEPSRGAGDSSSAATVALAAAPATVATPRPSEGKAPVTTALGSEVAAPQAPATPTAPGTPPDGGKRLGAGGGRRPQGRIVALVAAMLALVGAILVVPQLLGDDDSGNTPPASTPSTSAPAAALEITDARASTADEHGDEAANSITGSEGGWRTSTYKDGPELQIKRGAGVVYDLGEVKTVQSVQVRIGVGGSTMEMLAADTDVTSMPPSFEDVPDGFSAVATAEADGTSVTLKPPRPVETRFVVVWFTSLPRQATDGNAYPNPYYNSIVKTEIFGS